jgi:hypothetical protein
MKLLFTLTLLFPFFLSAQFVAPAASPAAETKVEVGYTNLSISYHRPNVRGRVIFGELLPWSKIWRAGANENTILTVDGPVTIGETEIPEGSYSLFLIPEKEGNWTWVINSDTENWGARDYDRRHDIVRVPAKPRKLTERIETLEYRWLNVDPQSVDLTLEWEWQRLSLPISLPTEDQVADRASLHLNPAGDPNEYYAIARYYLDNGMSLTKAKAWMDRWAAKKKEQFGRTRYQAIIEYKLGNEDKGKRLMQRSLELAREAGNEHYIRMNEQSLKDWTRELTEISADSLLARSLQYHDPDRQWGRRTHLLQLAESRPDNSVRHTRLTLYPHTADFDLQQTRGRDKVQMRYLDGTYSFSLNGNMDISEEKREKLRLTEDRTLMMRDYYTYLFGLPMKLQDAGTLLQPNVHKVWFDNKKMLELEVHYAPETGKDIWFFYFDPETYALSGYAFYHEKDGPGTGEYILLEGETIIDRMKLPAERHWYYTKNKLYLGTDEILN